MTASKSPCRTAGELSSLAWRIPASQAPAISARVSLRCSSVSYGDGVGIARRSLRRLCQTRRRSTWTTAHPPAADSVTRSWLGRSGRIARFSSDVIGAVLGRPSSFTRSVTVPSGSCSLPALRILTGGRPSSPVAVAACTIISANGWSVLEALIAMRLDGKNRRTMRPTSQAIARTASHGHALRNASPIAESASLTVVVLSSSALASLASLTAVSAPTAHARVAASSRAFSAWPCASSSRPTLVSFLTMAQRVTAAGAFGVFSMTASAHSRVAGSLSARRTCVSESSVRPAAARRCAASQRLGGGVSAASARGAPISNARPVRQAAIQPRDIGCSYVKAIVVDGVLQWMVTARAGRGSGVWDMRCQTCLARWRLRHR